MQVGLTEAAKLTGKDPSTITRAVNSGKISASQDANGSRVFDIAELERAFGQLKPDEQGKGGDGGPVPADPRIEEMHEREKALLREQIRMLERQVDDLKVDREKWQAQAGSITRLVTDPSGPADKAREDLMAARYSNAPLET